jgi:hypothetical protein
MQKKYNDQSYLCGSMIVILVVVLFILLISSCAIVSYEGRPDGSTHVSVYSLGSDKVLTDFKASIDKSGSRKLSIGSFDENQTEGLKQINAGMAMIVEGAAKGAVAGAK